MSKESDGEEIAHDSTTLGKYQLVGRIGRGGMSDVFLAVARGPVGFNKLVVVKRLLPHFVNDPVAREMFLDEARLAGRLNHPHVVQTFEVGEEGSTYFIAMEYLDGQSLRSVLRRLRAEGLRLTPVQCAAIVCDALSGLHYAHEIRDYDGTPLNLVHRDVSPHNIFITYEGTVKLVDFGIAKAALRSTHTEAGLVKGKAAYMAPEQACGLMVDRRADIFAAGIVLWELLTGERLFGGKTSTLSLYKLFSYEQAAPPSSVCSGIHPCLDEVTLKALAKVPDNRYETAREMKAALEEFVSRTTATGHEELGALVSRIFEGPRSERRTRIQTAIASLTAAHEDDWQDVTIGTLETIDTSLNDNSLSGSNSSVQAPVTTGEASVSLSNQAQSTHLTGSPKRANKKRIALALGVCFALVALASVRTRFQGHTPSATVEPLPSQSTILAGKVDNGTVIHPAQDGVPTIANESSSANKEKGAVPATRKPIRVTGGPHPPVKREADKAKEPAAPQSTSAVAAEPGYLTIDTSPWSRVFVDGRAVGTTPVARLQLSPGTHNVSLVNEEAGIRTNTAVSIVAGKTIVKRMALQ